MQVNISKQVEVVIKYLITLSVFVGLIITTFDSVVAKVTKKSRQRDARIERLEENQALLIHSANHSIEVDIALMDKIGRKYYVVDAGGSVENVMLFQTNDTIPEVFALVPDTTMLYTLHVLEWDDSRKEWEYIIDNEPVIIYER